MSTTTIENIPVEIICVEVFSYLTIKEISIVGQINLHFYELHNDEILTWKNINEIEFPNRDIVKRIIDVLFIDHYEQKKWKKMTEYMTKLTKFLENDLSVDYFLVKHLDLSIEQDIHTFKGVFPYFSDRIIQNLASIGATGYNEVFKLAIKMKKHIIEYEGSRYEGQIGFVNEGSIRYKTRKIKEGKGTLYVKNFFASHSEKENPPEYVRSYVGEWENDEKNGRGIMYYLPFRNRYEGEFKDGCRHGKGKFFFQNGNFYVGDFRENRKEGKGKFVFESGNVYEGEFVQDQYEGSGTFTYKGGSKYIGNFQSGYYHGQGILYMNSGECFEGIFKENSIKKGKHSFDNGDFFEGSFSHDGIDQRREVGTFQSLKLNFILDGKWEFQNLSYNFEGSIRIFDLEKSEVEIFNGKWEDFKEKDEKVYLRITRNRNVNIKEWT